MDKARSFFIHLRLFLLVALALLCSGFQQAGAASTVTLAWDANTEPDVTGYRVYYRTPSDEYTTWENAGTQTTITLSTLPPGNYFAAVTAVNGTGLESGLSGEVPFSITIPGASNNADLSGLAISAGTLSPAFASGTTAYSASVPNATTSITVTPTLADTNASVRVNGTVVASGSASGALNLNVGANAITIAVTAQDGATTKTYTVTVTRAASSNANLSALTISAGTLAPAFASATTSYSASVGNGTTSVTVTPTLSDASATVRVNGVVVSSGAASGAVALNVGANSIAVAVTAQDGTTSRTYTVTVTRAPSANADLSTLTLSAGTLSPTFASGTTTYSASVANTTTSLTVTPTLANANATVRVNGTVVASGSASGAVSLNVGANAIAIVVTAQDGVTTRTYTVTVTRAASSNANLSALIPSVGTLSPAFASATTAYSVSVPNATTSVSLTPTLADATASMTVNGVPVPSGSATGPLSLNVGANAISIVVTAQNGVATRTYTVTVNRAAVVDANLASLITSAGTLSPAFASAVTTYSAAVANSTASITVTPTLVDVNATVRVNGAIVQSGSSSSSLSLSVGANLITVLVTAIDGTTTKSYSLTVTRATGDSTAPGLAVLNPQPGATLIGTASGQLTINGVAFDNTGVNQVLVSLNGGTFAEATLTAGANPTDPVTWTLSVTPENGSNVIVARALDAGGNTSANKTVNFQYVVVRPQLAGGYSGLATPTANSTNAARQLGIAKVAVQPTGRFTATLTLGGALERALISGTFNNEGAARFGARGEPTVEIKRRNLPTLTLTLNLTVEQTLTQRVTGELSENGVVVSTLSLGHLLYTSSKVPVSPKTNVPQSLRDPATDKGAYTAVLRALTTEAQGMPATSYPQGDGWALISVKPTGAVSVTGKLGDGQAFAYANYLPQDNVLPVLLSPYGGKGTVFGPVSFRDVTAQSDADGVGLKWYKPANPLDRQYRAGWENGIEVDLVGSKYVASALTGKTSLGNTPASTATEVNAVLTADEGGLASVLTEQLSILAPNRVVRVGAQAAGATPTSWTLTFGKTGGFAHRFIHPESGKATIATGVVLQKTQTAAGFFLGAPAAGSPAGTVWASGAVSVAAQ